MRVGSIPTGIAALVVALAVGFTWELRATSGEQPANAAGQPRPHAVVATRGDRIRIARRGDRLDAAERRLARRIFTARFASAFAAREMDAVDEVADNLTANDTALAYASPHVPSRSLAAQHTAPVRVAAPPKRSIVVAEKPTKAEKPEQQMRLASLGPASTAPDDLDVRTAIYDISAHTVYLPGGAKLEAHSGLGSHIDDPRSVSMHNRGVTPPNVYRLSLREHLFHGVRALRLTPVGDGNMYGRDGILAHTYMLGPNGQSNGCVSMRNYPAFLQAFLDGKVERLLVVDHLSRSNPRIASLR
jgi:hypothetical protein